MSISFSCPGCHKRFQVKDELAGKRAKCGCGATLQIPAIASPVTSSAFGGLLDDALATQPTATSQAITTKKCPACSTAVPDNAILCVQCGYDFRSKRKLVTAHEDDDTKKPRSKKKTRGFPTVLWGTFLSLIGAFAGALIWAVVAAFLRFEIGWIAWGVGALAGAGMSMGHDDDDGTLAGILAAVSALVGIIAAKVLIVVFVLAPLLVGLMQMDAPSFQRQMLAIHLAENRLEQQNINMEDVTEEQWNQVLESAEQEVTAFSDEEVAKRWDAIQEEFQAMEHDEFEDAEGNDDADEFVREVPDDGVAEEEWNEEDGLVKVFFKTMFGPIDGLFILLALATAYQIGSGSRTS